MAADTPVVDGRDAAEILEAVEAIVPHYTDRWDPDKDNVGGTLLALFAEMAGDVIDRLDQVPAKHRVAFFDALGFGRNPPQPAKVPLTFLVSEDHGENVPIPAGTQAVAPAAGGNPEQVFELAATEAFEGTPAALTAVYSVDPETDDVCTHLPSMSEGTETQVFGAEDIQRHALLLGHPNLFTLTGGSTVWLTLETNAGALESDVFTTKDHWQCYGEQEGVEDWYDLEFVSSPSVSDDTIIVGLMLPETTKGTTETTIAGTESRWLRCRPGADATEGPLFEITVSKVSLSLTKPGSEKSAPISPDQVLSGDVPIAVPPEMDGVVAPFGEGWPPRTLFYVNSEEAFTKADVRTVLNFDPTTEWTKGTPNQPAIEFSEGLSNGVTVMFDSVSVSSPFSGGRIIVKDHTPLVGPRKKSKELGQSEELPAGEYTNLEVKLDTELDAGSTRTLQAHLVPHERNWNRRDLIDDLEPVTVQKEVEVSGAATPQLSWEYWDGEGWSRLPNVKDDTRALRQSGRVSFTVPDDLQPTAAAGHDGHWIRVRLVAGEYLRLSYDENREPMTAPVGVPPQFGDLTIHYEQDTSATGAQPTHLFTNNNLTIVAEPFPSATSLLAPFRPLPDERQTLYLGFDRPLRDGPIQLLFAMIDQEYQPGFYPRLRWEYRPDPAVEEWARLDVEDGTESLTRQGIVALGFPEPTLPSVRFGRERHWIRARVDGNAFEQAATEPTETTTIPVGIYAIDSPRQRVVLSNDTADPVDIGGYHIEFECAAADERRRTFPEGTSVPAEGVLTISTAPESTAATDVPFKFEEPALDECVRDAVALLTPEGEVLTRRVEGDPAPRERWLETVPPAGRPGREPPVLRGVHPNTGWLENVRTIEEEILGTSDGTADQAFSVSTAPVLEPTVWVDELEALSEGERQSLAEADPTGVIAQSGPDGSDVAFWVRWTQVEHFLDSGLEDRHYRIEPTMGRVVFGDGVAGRIPPRSASGIRIDYRSGGGAAGNVPSGAVADLKSSMPYVEGVTNPEPGAGGADAEPLAAVLDRAPKQLRDRDRAVTAADYERIALDASRHLARARCIPAMDPAGDHSPGWVTLLVVPNDPVARPVPSVALKHRIATEVSNRAPATLVAVDTDDANGDPTPELIVRGPSYVDVAVDATVVPGAVGSIADLEAALAEAIDAFLHPLTGGETGRGWQFGELPCHSDLYALLEGVEGVDHVASLAVTFSGEEESLTVNEGQERPSVAADTLVTSGTHTVVVDATQLTATGGGQ